MEMDIKNQLYEEIQKAKRYKEPFIIMLTGLPGSGKTHLSQELSRQLKIYLLSTDYIRNYFYQSITEHTEDNQIYIEDKVKKIINDKLQILVDNNISFVLDKGLNNLDEYNKNIFSKYKKILIKIISEDDNKNIERIQKRKLDFNNKDDTIIGDNLAYSSSYSAGTYYRIKENKKVDIPDTFYDIIIENNGSLDEYNIKIKGIIEKIKKQLNL